MQCADCCSFSPFQFGFNMIIEHLEAINSIALSLNHKSLRWVAEQPALPVTSQHPPTGYYPMSFSQPARSPHRPAAASLEAFVTSPGGGVYFARPHYDQHCRGGSLLKIRMWDGRRPRIGAAGTGDERCQCVTRGGGGLQDSQQEVRTADGDGRQTRARPSFVAAGLVCGTIGVTAPSLHATSHS